MINKSKTFSLDLSLFGGKVSDMAPGNLPAGASPACSDMFFGGQYTATRPALIHTLSNGGSGRAGFEIFSHNDYPQPNGQTETILLYNDGELWFDNPYTSQTDQIAQVTPGSRFKSIAAFNKFFMAFRSPVGGSLPNLSGYDMPRYINSQGNVRPVTQDAPGGGFSVTGVTIAPEDLVTPVAWLVGADITGVTLGGEKTVTVTIPNKGTITLNEFTTATITLDSAVTLAKGQIVQLYNIMWATPGGPQWANGIPVAAAVTSSTTFTINISGVTLNNTASAGTFAVQGSSSHSLTRQNNIVTGYLKGTTPDAPTQIQQGWYVNIVDTQATATAQLPDGTVPFTANELFQAIFPSSGGSGAAIGLLTGTTVLWNRWPEFTPSYTTPEPTGTYTWTYPGDGGNDPYQPSVYQGQSNAGTFTLEDDQSLLFNMEPSGFVPGFSFTNQSTQDNGGVAVPFLNADGSYAGTFNNIPTGPSFHGEGNNFDLSAYGSFTVSEAGNITFQISRSDGYMLGVKGATYVSGPQTSIVTPPQTLTAIKGYPLLVWNNTSGNGGSVDTFVLNFPAPGVYEFELDMRHWTSSRMWFDLVYQKSGVNTIILPSQGPGSATVKGDGIGNIHVTLPIAVEALPIGASLYLVLNPSAPANVINWTQSSDGTALIQLAANSNVQFTVGEEILLNGFQGSTQPTGWNGETVTITAVDTSTNTYQFAWSNTAGGGSSSTGIATPVSQQYPSGFIQVTQVISPTEFVYFAVGNTQTISSSGVVYDYFGTLNTQQSLTASLTPGISSAITASTAQAASGIVQGFQVLSVDTSTTPNSLTWFQSGFNDSYSGTHVLQVQPQSQMTGGPRNLLMFNINEDGGASPASYPIYVQLNGGTEFASVTLPYGPPGTVARAIAWTPAFGSYYYTLAPGNVPATQGNAPVINLGTIIYDNTTINTIMDFSDTALENGTIVGPVTPENSAALSDDFGDLTSTIVLPPCAGVIEYNEQLGWWGELNCLPNHSMINMGFDGNYDGTTTIGLNAQPLGWDNETTYNSITPDGKGFLDISPDGLGFVYTLSGTTGTLTFVIYSPSVGVIATNNSTIDISTFTSTPTWYQSNFGSVMPQSIPPDAVFFFYVSGGTANSMLSQSFYQDYYGTPIGLPGRSYMIRFKGTQHNSNTQLDDLQIIDVEQPVLNNQLRLSYEDNEFGYDNENGFVVGLDTTDFIAGCFLQRQYLYALTDGIGEQHTILANANLPSEWDVSIHAKECACAGPDAVTSARSTSWWMGRHGVQVFNGDQPKKISQAVAQDFELTNWNAASNSCMAADTVQRVVYMSFPTGGNTNNSLTYSLNTRLADNEVNVADPVHVSSYTGRIISTDLGEKWCPSLLPFNSMNMCIRNTQNGFAKVMTFGGGADPNTDALYGQLYLQDYWNYPPVTPSASAWNCLDADYGVINWNYQTYFFISHDVEKQAQEALYRKLFGYMSVHASGVGLLQIQPFVASLTNPWPALAPFPIPLVDPGADFNLGLNVLGERMSLNFTGVPAGEGQGTAMLLTHLIISLREDGVFPVSGLW